jgi:hypothetical protein
MLTLGVAYWWFSDDGAERASESGVAELADSPATAVPVTPPSVATAAAAAAVQSPESKPATVTPARTGPNSVGLPCEDFLKDTSGQVEGRLPTHLERSAVDTFIGENAWAKPCRGRRRHTAELCVATQDGQVKGLSVTIAPPDLTLETCLREQAAKLTLQPEAAVRVIRTSLVL